MELIFYDLSSDKAYREGESPIANTNKPDFVYKTTRDVSIQYLNTLSKDSSDDYDDKFTGWASRTISASVAIDNNAVHYYDGLLKTTLTAATPVTTIDILITSGTPRIAGTIKFTNAAGEIESVNYNTFTEASNTYTFITADADFVIADFTPTYNHVIDDTSRVRELPIIKTTPAQIDLTDKDTGLIIATIPADSLIFGDMIEGSWMIDNPLMELQIFDSLGELETATKWGCILSGVLDDDGNVPPPPISDFYNKTASIAKFVEQDLDEYPAIATPAGTDEIFARQGAASKRLTLTQIQTFATTITGSPNGNSYVLGIDDTDPTNPIITIADA